MNRNRLIEKFPELKNNLLAIENTEFKNATINLNQASSDEIVFYNIPSSDSALNIFKSRLKESHSKLVFIKSKEEIESFKNVIQVSEKEFIELQKYICEFFYNIDEDLKLIGVTGTNGKTTVASLVTQLASQFDKIVFSIGTNGILDNQGHILEDLGHTTPSYVELMKVIYKYHKKVDGLVLEVSSHALEQGRLGDISLDAVGWTNLTQDHLDYHETMDAYYNAKKKIVAYAKSKTVHLPKCSNYLIDKLSEGGVSLIVANEFNFKDYPLFLDAKYNQANLMLSLSLIEEVWKTKKNIDLMSLTPAKGRFDIYEVGNKKLIIDYAHTPDALENILSSLRSAYPEREISTVFGCGGNRDKTKRPLMGKAVEKFADKIFITDDNPRFENSDEIISDIEVGINSSYEKISNREEAIMIAFEKMKNDGVLLIAGKGHEEYQEVKGIKLPYSDYDVIKKLGAKC